MMRLLALAALLAAPALAAEPPRDPFAPYGVPTDDDALRCWPHAEVPLGALRLSGVVVGVATPRAMVIAPDGSAVNLRVGALLGKEGGVVKAIRRDRVVVEVQYRDALNRLSRELVELQLRG